MTVSASVFAQAGLSAKDYSALVGTAQAKTQESGKVVARGMRTILMNIRQIKGTDLETGEIIDENSLAKAESTLERHWQTKDRVIYLLHLWKTSMM